MQLDLDYIKNVLEQILTERFPEGERRRVVQTDKDFTMCCPICGDSAKDKNKKRGHLYFNSMMYRCYNETCRSSFTSLASKYNIQLDPDKKMAIIQFVEANVAYRSKASDEYVMNSLDKLIPVEDVQNYFDSGNAFLSSFRPCQSGDAVYMYLLNRGLPAEFIKENIYCAVRYLSHSWKEPVAVFLNRVKDKVLGLQLRNLKDDKRQRTFKIYNFEALYNEIYDEPIDEMEAIAYNKLSYLFNIMNVDFEQPVTIFEGFIDSIFYPNSIGATGTNTDFSLLIQNELPIRFFFDNDKTGQKKALEYMNMGYSVFLWQKLFDTFSRKNGDYYENMKILNGIKDLNKLAQTIANPYRTLQLEKFFSQDRYDIQWIPKYKYEKKDYKKEQRMAEIEKHLDNNQWDELKNLLLKPTTT